MPKQVSLIIILFIVCTAHAQLPGLRADSIYYQMKKVADWQWTTLETEGWKNSKKDWTSGAMYAGMMAWGKIANDETYYKKLIQVGEDNKWQIGKYRQFADDYCVGQLYSQLYTIYKAPRYIEDFKSLADTIAMLPHTDSLEWKKGIHLREWAWCDALFMAPPALAYLTEATGDAKYLNTTSKLWWKSTEYLYDKEEHLYYRDSRYFTKKEKNGAKVFWSRGNGWVMGGMVRVLSVMPKNHPDREQFIQLFKDMSAKIASIQQPDGSWHASLLDPDTYPIKETSGTGFFCYALTWGINQGILPYKKYAPVVVKAWNALTTSIHPNGKLGYVQAIGAAPDKVGYEDTDVYGVGAFLLAGSEMLRLTIHHEKNTAMVEAVNQDSIIKNEKVMVDWTTLSSQIKKLKAKGLQVQDALTGVHVPFEFIYNDKNKPKAIVFHTSIAPGGCKLFRITKVNNPSI
ncbi:glycoside hydrolase family 88 protein [Chitinophagaceae bacterium LB-8]|uniref:Glycoside hydrolase family 88 protein n=1 Tax=Paraflavisolibacter caeni TaxID=2982496 RepID=A0A9X3BJH3_9BACT|nr:glycoside hydrolase family 88 protein [Paraflavisolibacter caeni]MCU7552862.1 glycoside hydrolase family 88 protein [Paraflavisolibacter caeni]